MMNSFIIDTINNNLKKIQNKLSFVTEYSYIAQKIDFIIFLMIISTLLSCLFFESSFIGVLSICTFFITFIKLLITKDQVIKLNKYNFILFVFFFFSIISTINSSLPLASLKGLLKTVTYLCFYFSLEQFFRFNTSKIKVVLYMIAIFCLFESVVALVQNYLGVMPLATWQDTSYLIQGQVLTRVFGSLKPYNPNLLGGYLIPSFAILIGVAFSFLQKKYIKLLPFLIIPIFISVLAIIFTGSRGAYLALFVMFLTIALLSYKIIFDFIKNDFLMKLWQKTLICLTSISIIYVLCTPAVLKRIFSIFLLRGDSSTSFRMNVYNASLQMFLDNPLFGIGLGNTTFREIYGYYMRSGFDALSAYNIFLETAVEMGILGLFIFVLYLFLICKDSFKYFLSVNTLSEKILIASLLTAIIGLLTHGLFDTAFYRPQIQILFWVIMALLTVKLENSQIKFN